MRRLVLSSTALCAALVPALQASAQHYWNNPNVGAFSDPANWCPAPPLPTTTNWASLHFRFDRDHNDGTCSVFLPLPHVVSTSSRLINALHIDDDIVDFQQTGSLSLRPTVVPQTVLSIGNTSFASMSSRLRLYGASTSGIIASGPLGRGDVHMATAPNSGGVLELYGPRLVGVNALYIRGFGGAQLYIGPGSTVDSLQGIVEGGFHSGMFELASQSGSPLTLVGPFSGVVVDGTWTVANDLTIGTSGSHTIPADFIVRGSVSVGGSLTVRGGDPLAYFTALRVNSGGSLSTGPASIGTESQFSSTSVFISGGGLWTATGHVTLGRDAAGSVTARLDVCSGQLRVNGGSVLVKTTARLKGADSPSGDSGVIGSVSVQGGLEVGCSPGRLTIEGDYTQSAGQLTMEITGTEPGQYDELRVLGTATLGGTLVLNFTGFTPPPGPVTIPFLTATGGITGSFAHVTLINAPPGLSDDPAQFAGGSVTVGGGDPCGTDSDGDGVGDDCDGCPGDGTKTEPGACGCGVPDTDSDGDGTPDCNDLCPNDAAKTAPGVCGCGSPDADADGDGTPDCDDLCPGDPGKIAPGQCGCGIADTDTDQDGTADCLDGCIEDAGKTSPGTCGCGVPDVDSDGDGILDCNDNCDDRLDSDGDGASDCIDGCPQDFGKTEPGLCGCGVADTDSDGDGTPDCHDLCPDDPAKTNPGHCGCGQPETDSDGAGLPDCLDGCPLDPQKGHPAVCGCGVEDTDSDSDGAADCIDECPADPNKVLAGVCGCGTAETDTDADGTPDCIDQCVEDPAKTEPGACGCHAPDIDSDGDGVADCSDVCPGAADVDSDGDGTLDCNDGCPNDAAKTAPGPCGCGTPDTDSDGDAAPDCLDHCPSDPNKTSPGACGCGRSDSEACAQGCGQGYWKNHTDRWPVAYATTSDFDAVFGVNAFTPDITLLQALKREGGGVNALARQAVAALLNAASPDVAYPTSVEQVIVTVQSALAGGGSIEAAKNEFERNNRLDCPLDGTRARK